MKIPMLGDFQDKLLNAGQFLLGVLAGDSADWIDDPRFGPAGGISGGMSKAGVRVDSNSSMNHAAFYACLKVISETYGRVPIITYNEGKGAGDDRERAYNAPEYDLLTRHPNRWQTPYYFKQTWAVHKMLAGNFIGEIYFNSSTGLHELVPLVPSRYEILEPIDERSGPSYRAWDKSGRVRTLLRDEVLHDPMMSADGYKGLSVLSAAREALGLGLATSAFASRYFAKGVTQRGIVSTPKLMSPKARASLEKQMQGGLDKANGLLIIEEDAKFFGVTLSPRDSQLLEAAEFNVAQIARFFLVPLAKIGYLKEGAAYASVEQFILDFISSTMDPYFVAGEEELNRTLIDRPRMFVEFLRQALVQADMMTRWRAYAIALNSGVYAPNEVRKFENMPALEGLDRPLRRLDMAPTKTKEEAAAKWQGWEGKAADMEGRLRLARAREGDTSRTRAWAEAAARVLARREERFLEAWDGSRLEALEEFYRGQARRVARDLAVSEAQSLLWAENRGNAVLDAVTGDKEFDRRRFARTASRELVKLALEEERHAA